MIPHRLSILFGFILSWWNPSLLSAQAGGLLPRYQGENPQTHHRLLDLEQQIQPAMSPESISLLVRFPLDWHETMTSLPLLQPLDGPTWEEAIKESLKLVRDHGDELVPLGEPGPYALLPPPLVPVRTRAALLVSTWPAPVREKFRVMLEDNARALLNAGLAERSERPLRRLVEEAYLSQSAGKALDLLGDLAFTRGDLQEALGWWGMLTPLPTRVRDGEEVSLPNPDLALDLAAVRAKQVLALAYLGDPREAKRQRDAFALLHPEAAGNFAGRKGHYLKTLEDLIAQFHKAGAPPLKVDWSSLGGGPAGHAVYPQPLPEILIRNGPTWKVPLPDAPKRGPREEMIPPFAPQRPPYHPLILGDRVVLADSQSVTVLGLATGKEMFRLHFPEAAAKLSGPGVPVFAPSGARQLVVARIGQPPHFEAALKKPMESTWLVGVDLKAEGGKRLRWKVGVPAGAKGLSYFNGPPLLYQGKVWVPFREFKGGSLIQGLASLHPETGQWLTTTHLAILPPPPGGREGSRQPVLLTGAGHLVVCVNQAGTVAAVDSHTGKVAWGLRYSTQGPWTRLGLPSARDLAPALYALGRVFVAPQDSDLLLCLDGQTGQVRWEREGLDVGHLLGCVQGKLVFTTRNGLRAVSSDSGSDREGWQVPELGRLGTRGRGVILDDWVLWPTEAMDHPVRGLSMAQGKPGLPPGEEGEKRSGLVFFGPGLSRRFPSGNYALAHGCLVIAGDREMMAFVNPGLLPDVPGKAPEPLLSREGPGVFPAGH